MPLDTRRPLALKSGRLNLSVRFNVATQQGKDQSPEAQLESPRLDVKKRSWFGSGRPIDAGIILERAFSGDVRSVVHEFGHILGLRHRHNPSDSVMSYSEQPRWYFDQGEVDALLEAYR